MCPTCNRKHLTDEHTYSMLQLWVDGNFAWFSTSSWQGMSSHQWILLMDFEWRVCGTMGFSFTSNQDFLPAIPCESNTNKIHKMKKDLFPSVLVRSYVGYLLLPSQNYVQRLVMSPHNLSKLSCVFNQFGREKRPRIFYCWVKGGI